MRLTDIFRTEAYTKQTMKIQPIRRRDRGAIDLEFYGKRPLSERAGISTAIVTQVGSAVRPTVAVVVVMLTVWAMPGIEPGNRDVAAQVAIAMTPLAQLKIPTTPRGE